MLFTFSLQCCNGSKPHSWFQSLALSLAKETTPSSASLSMQGSVPCLRQFLSSHSSTLEVIKATADGYNLYNLEICIIVQTKVLERFLGRAEEKKKVFLTVDLLAQNCFQKDSVFFRLLCRSSNIFC